MKKEPLLFLLVFLTPSISQAVDIQPGTYSCSGTTTYDYEWNEEAKSRNKVLDESFTASVKVGAQKKNKGSFTIKSQSLKYNTTARYETSTYFSGYEYIVNTNIKSLPGQTKSLKNECATNGWKCTIKQPVTLFGLLKAVNTGEILIKMTYGLQAYVKEQSPATGFKKRIISKAVCLRQ